MLAELAAFNAGFAIVKSTVAAGRDIASAASGISKMVENKDAMHKRLQKKKNSIFTTTVESDLEEFMALESMKQNEAELKQIMIYQGRPGLHGDFLKFCADARKARKEAERRAQQEREEMIETITVVAGVGIGATAAICAIIGLVWYFKGF
tara:strand:- start:1951 stop:2403 length:453 start_codon:yes stop_codon:yes gene_type:complete